MSNRRRVLLSELVLHGRHGAGTAKSKANDAVSGLSFLVLVILIVIPLGLELFNFHYFPTHPLALALFLLSIVLLRGYAIFSSLRQRRKLTVGSPTSSEHVKCVLRSIDSDSSLRPGVIGSSEQYDAVMQTLARRRLGYTGLWIASGLLFLTLIVRILIFVAETSAGNVYVPLLAATLTIFGLFVAPTSVSNRRMKQRLGRIEIVSGEANWIPIVRSQELVKLARIRNPGVRIQRELLLSITDGSCRVLAGVRSFETIIELHDVSLNQIGEGFGHDDANTIQRAILIRGTTNGNIVSFPFLVRNTGWLALLPGTRRRLDSVLTQLANGSRL